MGERLKERRRNINQKVSLKGVMVPEQRFFRFPQCCTKFETKESKASRNSKNDRKGRNRHNQQRKKKNNDSCSRSRSNSHHNSHKLSRNKPIKDDKKRMTYTS